jgi:hypothetical protein
LTRQEASSSILRDIYANWANRVSAVDSVADRESRVNYIYNAEQRGSIEVVLSPPVEAETIDIGRIDNPQRYYISSQWNVGETVHEWVPAQTYSSPNPFSIGPAELREALGRGAAVRQVVANSLQKSWGDDGRWILMFTVVLETPADRDSVRVDNRVYQLTMQKPLRAKPGLCSVGRLA